MTSRPVRNGWPKRKKAAPTREGRGGFALELSAALRVRRLLVGIVTRLLAIAGVALILLARSPFRLAVRILHLRLLRILRTVRVSGVCHGLSSIIETALAHYCVSMEIT